MDLILLRSLMTVAELGTVTGAADRLNITQPALSRRIHQLEEHFGTPLLTRNPKGVALTAMGERVVQEARLLTRRYDNLRAEIGALTRLEGGLVRIGGGATAASFVLPGAIASFQLNHPAIHFEVKEAGSQDITQQVIDGQLELGIVTLPVSASEISQHSLMEDQIVLICNHRHPLASAKGVTLQQLAGLGLVGFDGGSAIRQLIDRGLTQRWHSDERGYGTALHSCHRPNGHGHAGNLAFVSQLGVPNDKNTRVLRVPGLSIRRKLAVITRRDNGLPPITRRAKFRCTSAQLRGERAV